MNSNDFELNIFESVSIYDPGLYFRESSDDYFLYKEAGSEGVTKKNFLQKAWEMIKKVFAWFGKIIMKIINFIKSIFTKGISKTADQCAFELFKPNKSLYGDEDIELPSSSRSTVNVPDKITVPAKNLMLKLNKKENKIVADYDSWYDKSGDWNNLDLKQPGHNRVSAVHVTKALAVVGNEELCRSYFKTIEDVLNLYNGSTETTGLIGKDLLNSFYKMQELWRKVTNELESNSETTFSLANFITFQKEFNAAQDKFTKIDHAKRYDFEKDIDAVEVVNRVLSTLVIVQMGLNAITGSISNLFIVDVRFKGTADTPEKLAKFSKNLVDAGIPPKFISYNCYVVASDDIKGDPKLDGSKPCWGQTRVVLFPKDENIIYKIALSTYGRLSNKSEYDISAKARNVLTTPEDTWPIALTYEAKQDSQLVVSERVEAGDDLEFSDKNQLYNFEDKLSDFIQQVDIPQITDYSIYSKHNIGKRQSNGIAVIIDYGMAERTINTKQTS